MTTHYGIEFWRQAEYSDLLLLKSWCENLSDACWQTGHSGIWDWFAMVCGAEVERRPKPECESLCWDLPSMFYASPSRLVQAAQDMRALGRLCNTEAQRSMVDRLQFDLLELLASVVDAATTEVVTAQQTA